MVIGQEFFILGFDWARIHFTENKGMAFGWEFGGEYGKLALSLFRIFAVCFMGYYINRLIKENAHIGLVCSLSLIMAGAIGNILDSAFYGLIFSDSFHKVAELFPEGGGYAPFLYGRVVDMFFFPLFDGYLPEWLPFKGGDRFIFFRPVFNVADSAISIGVVLIVLFQKRFFLNPEEENTESIEGTPTVLEKPEQAENEISQTNN